MAHLALDLLGTFRAMLDDEPVPGLQSSRLQGLLAYLAVEEDRNHARRTLAEMIWPNRPEGEALKALRYALSNLRTAIGDREADPPYLHVTRSTLRFNAASDATLDVERFQRQIDAAEAASDERTASDALESAVALYRGEFLEGLFLSDAVVLEEWVLLQRELLARQAASALGRLATIHERDGAYRSAQAWAQQRLRIEPWNEAAHRQLMRALALDGQRGRALAQYETCRQRLNEELGVEPGRATRTLYQAIREGQLKASTRRTAAPATAVPSAPFVAREEELGRLDRLLGKALQGQGRVAFVTGEAGRGKTALWRAFVQRAMETHDGLVFAAGRSSAVAGAGDPYLPFREILQTLTGDVEPQRAGGAITTDHACRLWDVFPAAAQILVTYGPDLVDRFVPGKPLLTRAEAFASREASWLPRLRNLVDAAENGRQPARSHQIALFEQTTTVLRLLAQRHPLVLLVDDLQWTDRGSLGLLFHIGKRLADSRILLVGAYRPGDLAQTDGGRHPLKPIVNELQRDFGELRIDLDQTSGRAFVDAYLDTQPNRLGEPFREALARHTGGNPLFTIEMLQALQERDDLVQGETGQWVAREDLDWDVLPARVEAVIAERVRHLPPQARRLLSVASVAGETFVAEIVARAVGIDESEVFRRLKQPLSDEHRLVRLQRVARGFNDGRRVLTCQFRHVLFQRFFYNKLGEAERIYLHEQIGTATEAICDGSREQLMWHASRLAYHFQEAGVVAKAITYRQQAGERAVRLSANEEAVYHLAQGLALIETLPATAQREVQEVQLLLTLAASMRAAQRYDDYETRCVYDRMLALCRRLDDMPNVRPVMWQLGVFYVTQADYGGALEVYEHSLKIAEETGHSLWGALARWARGSVLMVKGRLRRAAADLQAMVACYNPEDHYALAHQLGCDPGVGSLAVSAFALWPMGYPDQALERIQKALALARTLGHARTQVLVVVAAGLFLQMGRYDPLSRTTINEAWCIAEEHGLSAHQVALSYLEGLLQAQESGIQGIRRMARAVATWEDMGNELLRPHMIALLAEAHGKLEHVERGLALLDEALVLVEARDERYFEAEIQRLRGDLLLMAGDKSGAEVSFRRAIEVAQEQEAKSWELRAALSLSRLWRHQGQDEAAHKCLTDVFNWFSEDSGTRDLREAQSLLDELSTARLGRADC